MTMTQPREPDRWPDGEPVTPWADPWHDVLGDVQEVNRRIMEGLTPADLMPPEPDRWLALCAPGRRLWAALACAMRPEVITDVRESPLMKDRPDDIILVNVTQLPDWLKPEAGL